jgi:hypothetical protein
MSDTPRTDAERRKTHTPEYEYEGAECEAWEWAQKLERELNELKNTKPRLSAGGWLIKDQPLK